MQHTDTPADTCTHTYTQAINTQVIDFRATLCTSKDSTYLLEYKAFIYKAVWIIGRC